MTTETSESDPDQSDAEQDRHQSWLDDAAAGASAAKVALLVALTFGLGIWAGHVITTYSTAPAVGVAILISWLLGAVLATAVLFEAYDAATTAATLASGESEA